MIAIISDLHLQHTSWDGLRYRDENGKVWEVGVRRNVTADAFERFTGMIEDSVTRHNAEEVHLVFAGDIFELHRTPLWFMSQDSRVRPYIELSEGNAAVTALRNKVLIILEQIKKNNEELFQAVKKYVESLQARPNAPRLQVHYIPGNHDRLANAWPSVRRRVREMLAMEPGDQLFPNKLDFTGDPPDDYGVRIRHGHEYSRSNFRLKVQGRLSLRAKPKDYLRPCFGDYATIDLAGRLPLAFRVYHAPKLRGDNETSRRLRELYKDLTEFDDVRPLSLLFEYLETRMGTKRTTVFNDVRPILRDMVETGVQSSFLKKEARRLKMWDPTLVTLLQESLKNLSAKTLANLVPRIVALAKGEGGNQPADLARFEEGLGEKFNLVIAGHTHHPDQVPLPGDREKAQNFYLDTGTWRTTIPCGMDSFGRLRAYTMVFCYNHRERNALRADGRRFESWTGRLAWDKDSPKGKSQAIPYTRLVEEDFPPADVMQLRFQKLHVVKAPREIGSAELEMHFGVDGEERLFRQDRVRDGDKFDLSELPKLTPIGLDPALDGEVWTHGKEIDLGDNPFNRDDPLPWAIDRLLRDDTGQFAKTQGQLILTGKAKTHMVVEYQVERRA